MATNIVIKNARFGAFEDNELEDFLKPKQSKNTKKMDYFVKQISKQFTHVTQQLFY